MRLPPKGLQFLLVLLAVVCWATAGLLVPRINRQRSIYRVTEHRVLENAPPGLAVATTALGGFRAILINYLWLRVTALERESKYYEMVQLCDWIGMLEPRIPEIWTFNAWTMSYNISVVMHKAVDRWRWVYKGIQYLRDKGLAYNPNTPQLYWELAYVFLNKIGLLSMDECRRYYQREWQRQMALIFEPGVSVAHLARAPATRAKLLEDFAVADLVARCRAAGYHPFKEFFEAPPAKHKALRDFLRQQPAAEVKRLTNFLRAQRLRRVYKMEPYKMLALMQTYLFSIPGEEQQALEQGKLRRELRQVFAAHRYTLSNKVRLSTVQAGRQWRLWDQRTRQLYTIVKNEFELSGKYAPLLDIGLVTPELRQQFEKTRNVLAKKVTVVVQRAGQQWLLCDPDNEKEYQVVKRGRQLVVRETGRKLQVFLYLPHDWLLWHAHALYWAQAGLDCLQRNPELKSKVNLRNFDRIKLNALKQAFLQGRLIFQFQGVKFPIPQFRFLRAVHEAFEQVGKKWEKNEDIGGHEIFLQWAIFAAFMFGHEKLAREYFGILQKKWPRPKYLGITTEEFVLRQLRTEIKYLAKKDVLEAYIAAVLFQSLGAYWQGDPKRAFGLQQLARKMYAEYKRRLVSPDAHRRLERARPFAFFQRSALILIEQVYGKKARQFLERELSSTKKG